MLRCPNGLCHIFLDVLMASWREKNIFGFLGFGTQIEGRQNMVSTLTKTINMFFLLVYSNMTVIGVFKYK